MDEQHDQQPENPAPENYAGRRDLNDLKQAYLASGQEAQRLVQENQRLAAELQMRAQPRPEPNPDPYSELEGLGVPSNPLRAAIQREAAQFFAPVVRQLEGQAQARNHMLATYGDEYVNFEQKVAQNIQSDPQLQQRYGTMFQADPVAATEWAYLKYGETQRRSAPSEPGKREAREQQAQAAIPSGRQGEGRNAPSGQDHVQRAYDNYQKAPTRQNAEAFAKARLKQAIPDEFLFGRQLGNY